MKALLLLSLSTVLLTQAQYTGNYPDIDNKFIEPLDDASTAQPGYNQHWLPVRTHMQEIGDLVELEFRCEDRSLYITGFSENPWRGYQMHWEIWRHDGPNPGYIDEDTGIY